MSQKELSQSYAEVVYALAVEGWQRALLAVADKLTASPELLAELNNVQTPFSERQQKLEALLPAEAGGAMKNFFFNLLKEGHLSLLNNIVANLMRVASQSAGLEVVTVTTAIPLNDAEQDRFRQKLGATHGDQLEFEFTVDEAILGGVIVQVGDKIIDASIRNKLDTVRERLTSAV